MQYQGPNAEYLAMLRVYEAILIAVWSATFALAPVYAQTEAASGSGVEPAEYEVLSAYISAEFIGKRGAERVAHEVSQIVIEDETQSDDDDSFLTDDKNWHLAELVGPTNTEGSAGSATEDAGFIPPGY
jgi:hypothetical protein